ncbi:hypothetical protein ACS0TY_016479 [Phlomoides rotata]
MWSAVAISEKNSEVKTTSGSPQQLIMSTKFPPMWADIYSGFAPNNKKFLWDDIISAMQVLILANELMEDSVTQDDSGSLATLLLTHDLYVESWTGDQLWPKFLWDDIISAMQILILANELMEDSVTQDDSRSLATLLLIHDLYVESWTDGTGFQSNGDEDGLKIWQSLVH